MNRKIFPLLIAAVISLPVIAGSVIVGYNYNIQVSQIQPGAYLTYGKNYQTYNSSDLIGAYASGTPPVIASGTTIYFNRTLLNLFGNDNMLFVLQVNNTYSHSIYLWINGSLPSGITMYYKNHDSGSNPGTAWNSGTRIKINSGKNVYLSFSVGVSSSSGSLEFTYILANGVITVWNYNVQANYF